MSIQSRFQKFSVQAVGLLAIGVCLVAANAASAQSTDPLDTNNERTSDPFNSLDNNDYSPFFNIMHRMQLGNIRSVSEFSQDQQQSLGTEASDFRARQLQQINQQGAVTAPGTPAPGTGTPSATPLQNPTVQQ